MGKHNKSITCGAWSEANLLALGSEDRTLSISNVEGDTLRVATLRAEPSDIQFSEMKQVRYLLKYAIQVTLAIRRGYLPEKNWNCEYSNLYVRL